MGAPPLMSPGVALKLGAGEGELACALAQHVSKKLVVIDPRAIAVGPDGALWFALAGETRIGRMTTAGAVDYFSYDSTSPATSITRGPEDNMWFSTEDGIRLRLVLRLLDPWSATYQSPPLTECPLKRISDMSGLVPRIETFSASS